MMTQPTTHSRTLVALVIACAMAVILAPPATAQTAKKLKCNGCVKSKHLKNNGVKGKDIKDGEVGNADLGNNAITTGKIADGAVTLGKLGGDVSALGLEGVIVVSGTEYVATINGANVLRAVNHGWVTGFNSCFVAPVLLPNGVTVLEVEAVILDSDAAQDFNRINLIRTDLDTTTPETSDTLAQMQLNGLNSPDLQIVSDITIDSPVIDAQRFMYFSSVCTTSIDQKFYALRIFYN